MINEILLALGCIVLALNVGIGVYQAAVEKKFGWVTWLLVGGILWVILGLVGG